MYGAIGSLLGVAAFNYFFTAPEFTLRATDAGYPVTFLVMLISSVISSSLAIRVKNQARQASRKAYYTELLLGSSQKLQQGRDEWEILQLAAGQLSRLLERPILYSLTEEGKDLDLRIVPGEKRKEMARCFTREELGVAQWAWVNNKHAGATTDTLPHAESLYLAVRGMQGVMGVVGIPIRGYPRPEAFEKNLMVAIINECGLILERRRLRAEKQAIEMESQQERLRVNLLRAISHDLRTPLTSISGNAGVLMERSISLDEDKKQELYLEEVFQEALSHLDRQAAQHHITTRLEDDLLMAHMDVRLIVQVIINIVNNAIKYTPEGSHIELSACRRGEMAEISIADDGPGISDEAKPHLFDMFYTASQGKADSRRGLGLGLSLCQSIVQAHGGAICALDNLPHGTVFRFTLPIAEVTNHG